MIVFDIETGPLADEQLRPLCPEFVPSPHPGEFDPSAVKVGNLKDAAKIQEKIEAARQAHQELISDFDRQVEAARAAHWAEFVGKAPLSALTGRVLAIGYRSERATVIHHLDDTADTGEAGLIAQFWLRYRKSKGDRRPLVGHNIAGFDIPFLVRRSWLLEIDVPDGVLDANWRYLDRTFIDTMQRWQAGNYRDQYVKLDALGKALGLGGKTEGVDGADFHRLYFGAAEERAKSLEYLARDVELTWLVAQRLGIV